MPKSDSLDLDALFGDRIAKNVRDAYVTKMTLFGREWHITDASSAVGALEALAGNDDAVLDYMLSFFVPDEQEEFRVLARRCQGLDANIVSDMLNKIIEKVSDRPTEPSPRSSGTSQPQKSQRRSTANSRSRVREEYED